MQFETLKKSLCSVFPDIDEINKDTIIELLLKKANEDADPESDVEMENTEDQSKKELMAESIGGFGDI